MIIIHSDGATVGHNGKPGTVKEVGLGVYIPSNGLGYYQRVAGISNNEAEFKALILAMATARHHGFKRVAFKLDSKIVVNRANGYRPTKKKYYNARMDAFQQEVKQRQSWFETVSFSWVPRELNTQADICSKLACKRLSQPSSTVRQIPLTTPPSHQTFKVEQKAKSDTSI